MFLLVLLLEGVADLSEELHFLGGLGIGRGGGSGLLLLAAHLVDPLDQQEDHDGDEQEVDDGLDEAAVLDGGLLDAGRLVRGPDDALQGGEVDAAEEGADDGHEHIVHQGLDDGGERAADDDAHGHIHHVATGDELLEFRNDAFFLHGCILLALEYGTVYHPLAALAILFCMDRRVLPLDFDRNLSFVIQL